MEFSKLFDDDRAVSPVIGVILMVAITVILAAVIGTFVLGLGDQVQQTAPQAQLGFSTGDITTNDATEGAGDVDYVNITHESGDTIAASDLKISLTGDSNFPKDWPTSGDVSAGSTVDVVSADDGNPDSDAVTTSLTDLTGETVRVIYDSPDSDQTSTLAKFEV